MAAGFQPLGDKGIRSVGFQPARLVNLGGGGKNDRVLGGLTALANRRRHWYARRLMSEVTVILQAVNRGEGARLEDLFSTVYEELRKIAAARMAHESAGHTLQPTALVHEAWLRMVDDAERNWKNRAYFFAAAAQAMRRILVEHARRKSRLKHGGGQDRVDIAQLDLAEPTPDDKILLVDEALAQLELEHPERARVVVLKYFGGLTNKETAETLGLGERTVNRHWICAKTWLFRKIQAAG